MIENELLRLTHIQARGLFGMYDHEIHLNMDDRVTLLHGPNGVGKTTLLQMVNALMSKNLSFFALIPMQSFTMHFHDSTKIELSSNEGRNAAEDTHLLTLSKGKEKNTVSFKIRRIVNDLIKEKIDFDFLRPLDRDSGLWIDMHNDEVLTESEVISRYGYSGSLLDHKEMNSNEWLKDFFDHAKVHFIQVQRLIQIESNRRTRYHMKPLHAGPRVIECSRDFHRRLDAMMANYGRSAQALDQSFPQRLISASQSLEPAKLQEKMQELANKTANLKEMGILDEAYPFNIPQLDDQGDSTQARVMTLYVQDTEKKLEVLEDLTNRAHMFLENINQKFRHKQIQIDRDAGLVVEGDEGQKLPLDSLSSGEQHELVLHYDLLFRVPSNTVVLIDEPELSLHLTWQKKFLPDLLEIVGLCQFDALIATHSPYIIDGRNDLTVPLTDSG
ncbi:MAG: AAA family ATPase [Gammaproteobacteria bacterium]|nr:AAA family ATPase [Gammaproteobacteria bacterium]